MDERTIEKYAAPYTTIGTTQRSCLALFPQHGGGPTVRNDHVMEDLIKFGRKLKGVK